MIDRSNGSAIQNKKNKVVGFFRYISNNNTNDFAVLATKIREDRQKICGMGQTW